MNPLHLLWIVPLSSMLGFLIASFCVVAGEAEEYQDRLDMLEDKENE